MTQALPKVDPATEERDAIYYEGDGMSEIQRLEREDIAREFETMGNKGTNENPKDGYDGTSKGPETISQEGKSEESSKRPGIDVVLREVGDKLGPEFADVIRSMQTATIQSQTERAQQERLLERIATLEQSLQDLAPQGDNESDDDYFSRVDPETRALYREMAEREGLVSRDQLAEERKEAELTNYVTSSIDEGIEKWGDRFGSRDANGEFNFNPEVYPQIEGTYRRIYGNGANEDGLGLTAQDLYVLTHWEQLVEDQVQAKLEEATNSRESAVRDRMSQLRRGTVESSTTSARPREVIYQKGKDDLATVVARASAQAMRERR
jgi:hypothetical protein